MIILSHRSALGIWRATVRECEEDATATSQGGIGFTSHHSWEPAIPFKPLRAMDLSQLHLAVSVSEVRSALRQLGPWLEPALVDGHVHLLFPLHRKRIVVPGVRSHSWCERLPRCALYRMSKNVLLSGPEFTLLQLAYGSTLVCSTSLSLEFCGFYSKADGSESKLLTRRTPLTTPSRIGSLIDELPGAHGIKLIERTLPYLTAGSASPMETNVAMLACLPRRYGGYGLAIPKFNQTIELSKEGERIMGMNAISVDLVWTSAHVAIEYNSTAEHGLYLDESSNGPMQMQETLRKLERRRKRDEMRISALSASGWKAFPLVSAQVYNCQSFDAVIRAIANALGKKIRAETLNFKRKRAFLRQEVLGLENQ